MSRSALHAVLCCAGGAGSGAQVGDVAVKPAANSWTEFQVTDVDGRVQIAANKGDVTVQEDKGTTTVSEGQQTTRDHTNDVEKRNGISAKVRVRPRGRRVEF